MPTYVALIRGINIGPRNKIAMADLRELLGSLGHEGVRTHILSGNAIFTSRCRSAQRLEADLEKAIRERFELDIRVLVRTADELAGSRAGAGGRRESMSRRPKSPAHRGVDAPRAANGSGGHRLGTSQGVRNSRRTHRDHRGGDRQCR
jgi:uncharacterized protein (DUF1697 family)